MDNNLIYNFVDIFTNYYNLYYSSKIFYSKNIRENKLYNLLYKNNVFNELYLLYFNNEKYYENNDIDKFKKDIESYIIKQYNKIKEIYNDEVDNFT